MILLSRQVMPEGRTDGNFWQAVCQPAAFCIPLFPSRRHPGLPPAAHSSGAHRLFLSRHARHLPHYQAGVAAENLRLPTLGGSLRSPPSHPAAVARPRHEEERPPAGRLRSPLPAGHGTSATLWRLLHLQNHGTGSPTFAPARPSTLPKILAIASSSGSGRVTPTSTSTFAMRCSVPMILCVGSFSPFPLATGSMVIPSSQGSYSGKASVSTRMTMPSSPSRIRKPCKPRRIASALPSSAPPGLLDSRLGPQIF